MYQTLLVPTDGSEGAQRAGEAAIELADRFGASLHVIHITDLQGVPETVDDDVREDLEVLGTDAIEAIADLARDKGIDVTTELIESTDPIHECILSYVATTPVDSIVMGTTGRSGLERLALGSVAERTLRESPVPVLTIPKDGGLTDDIDTILVPTDGSDGATAAVETAIEFARLTGAAIHVVHVVDIRGIGLGGGQETVYNALEEIGEEAINEVREQAKANDIRSVEASLLTGTPAGSIVDYVEDNDIDCIVMGTHGRTGVKRVLLGSVTERVIRETEIPVLTVKASLKEQNAE